MIDARKIIHDKKRQLVCLAVGFSLFYAVVEYYIIQDTTFGYQPVISLLYPYHFAMAGVFGVVSFLLLYNYAPKANVIVWIMTAGIIFSSMLVVEDFLWFTFRAIQPIDNDINAGRLVMEGEWTTQFFGSTDAYFTHIPNWYFAPPFLAGMTQATSKLSTKGTVIAKASEKSSMIKAKKE